MRNKRICLILIAILTCAFLFTSCIPQATEALPTLKPEPTFTASPTDTPTPEPTEIPEPFIEEIPEGDSLIEKVVSAAKEKLDFMKDGESPETENLIVVPFYVNNSKGEKNPFVMVGNNKDGSLFAAFSNEGDLINPVNIDKDVVFEQLSNYRQENDTLVGIPNLNDEGIMPPPIFTLSELGLIYKDLWNKDEISIDQSEPIGKNIKESLVELKDEWFEVVTEDMMGRNGITEYMLGGKIVSEKNHKFLVNEENKKVALLEKNKEWGEYLDVELINFVEDANENGEIDINKIPTIGIEDINRGRWARRIGVELERMSLDKQNIDTEKIKYFLNQFSDGSTYIDFLYEGPGGKSCLETITENVMTEPVITLFPFEVVFSNNLSALVFTSRVSQNDSEIPYILFNVLLAIRDSSTEKPVRNYFGSEETKLFTKQKCAYLPGYDWPDPTSNIFTVKTRYYPYFWNEGIYGSDGKATKLLDGLINEGKTLAEINSTLLAFTSLH